MSTFCSAVRKEFVSVRSLGLLASRICFKSEIAFKESFFWHLRYRNCSRFPPVVGAKYSLGWALPRNNFLEHDQSKQAADVSITILPALKCFGGLGENSPLHVILRFFVFSQAHRLYDEKKKTITKSAQRYWGDVRMHLKEVIHV